MSAASIKSNPIPEARPRLRGQIPKLDKIPPKKNFTYSFEYWQQHEYFGLKCEKVDASWLVALLEQLRLLSKEEIDEVIKYKRDALRFHEIDWDWTNVPIKKSDINWLHKDISIDELEICQVQISRAEGRIVGFFDDQGVFCVILLDPMHNLQPSKYNDYKIRPTAVLKDPHSILLNKLMHVHNSLHVDCKNAACTVKEKVAELLRVDPSQKYICINDLLGNALELLYDKGYSSVEDILIDALDLLMKQHGLSDATN